jgi:large subunit ribosomal protein L25
MALVELSGKTRDSRGKGAARTMRAQGELPGVIYGPGGENRLVTIEERSFNRLLRRAAESTVIVDLKIEGAAPEGLKVLVKEVQRDPITARPLHVDFLHIAMDRAVRLVVPVRLTGVPEGVRIEGGFLEHVLRDLEVECLPTAVPEIITLDVSPLQVGQALHASDVDLPGVVVVTPADRVVATVHGKHAEEEVAPTEAAAAPAEGEAAAEAAPAEGGKKKGSASDEGGGKKKGSASDEGGKKKGSASEEGGGKR